MFKYLTKLRITAFPINKTIDKFINFVQQLSNEEEINILISD